MANIETAYSKILNLLKEATQTETLNQTAVIYTDDFENFFIDCTHKQYEIYVKAKAATYFKIINDDYENRAFKITKVLWEFFSERAF